MAILRLSIRPSEQCFFAIFKPIFKFFDALSIIGIFWSKNKGGLAIVAMRHWSQWPFQFPIQNVKKGAFWRNFGRILDFFVWNMSQGPFDPSLSLSTNLCVPNKKNFS
jgi:hypothetical protein